MVTPAAFVGPEMSRLSTFFALPADSSERTWTEVALGVRTYMKLRQRVSKAGVRYGRDYSLLVTDRGDVIVDRSRARGLGVLLQVGSIRTPSSGE